MRAAGHNQELSILELSSPNGYMDQRTGRIQPLLTVVEQMHAVCHPPKSEQECMHGTKQG